MFYHQTIVVGTLLIVRIIGVTARLSIVGTCTTFYGYLKNANIQ